VQDVGKSKKGFMGFGGGADVPPVQPSGPSTDNVMSPGRPSSGGGQGISLGSLADPNDYIAAHFDKKVNEESARQSLPVDSWRWQKRFFIFSGQHMDVVGAHCGNTTHLLAWPKQLLMIMFWHPRSLPALLADGK
jgi:hypothetical protein